MCNGAGACRLHSAATRARRRRARARRPRARAPATATGPVARARRRRAGLTPATRRPARRRVPRAATARSATSVHRARVSPRRRPAPPVRRPASAPAGFCVDGVCCESACVGVCVACATRKTGQPDGTCRRGHGRHRSRQRVHAGSGSTAAGPTAMCDGAGACRRWAVGTSCVHRIVHRHHAHARQDLQRRGQLPGRHPTSCGAYVCGTTACKTTCASDDRLLAGQRLYRQLVRGAQDQRHRLRRGLRMRQRQLRRRRVLRDRVHRHLQRVPGHDDRRGQRALPSGRRRHRSLQRMPAGVDVELRDRRHVRRRRRLPPLGGRHAPAWANRAPCSTYTPARTCNGAGTCQMVTDTSCGAYMCGATACTTTCGPSADCTAGNNCSAGSCAAQADERHRVHRVRPVRAATSASTASAATPPAAEPARRARRWTPSGRARQRTRGPTRAANARRRPPRPAAMTASADGAGACRKHIPGTVCLAAGCSSAAVHAQSTCDGAGTCNAGASTSCGAYQCDQLGIACATSCTADANCNGGFCSATACYAPSTINLAGNGDLEYGNGVGWSTNGGAPALQNATAVPPGQVHAGTYAMGNITRAERLQRASLRDTDGRRRLRDQPVGDAKRERRTGRGGADKPGLRPRLGQLLPDGRIVRLQPASGDVDADERNREPDDRQHAVRSQRRHARRDQVRGGLPQPDGERHSGHARPNLFVDDLVIRVTDGHNLVGNPNFEAFDTLTGLGVTSGWATNGTGDAAPPPPRSSEAALARCSIPAGQTRPPARAGTCRWGRPSTT